MDAKSTLNDILGQLELYTLRRGLTPFKNGLSEPSFRSQILRVSEQLPREQQKAHRDYYDASIGYVSFYATQGKTSRQWLHEIMSVISHGNVTCTLLDGMHGREECMIKADNLPIGKLIVAANGHSGHSDCVIVALTEWK